VDSINITNPPAHKPGYLVLAKKEKKVPIGCGHAVTCKYNLGMIADDVAEHKQQISISILLCWCQSIQWWISMGF
jgi:hypothetical protein